MQQLRSMGDRADPVFDWSFTWAVENFSTISEMVKSPLFYGGADGVKVDWQIWLYPNGYKLIVYNIKKLSIANLRGCEVNCFVLQGDRADPMFDCSFTWAVENFSTLSEMVKSPLFYGGADGVKVDWQIWLYPNGYKLIVYNIKKLSIANLRGCEVNCFVLQGDRADPMFDCSFTWTVENFSTLSEMVKSPLFYGGADGVKVDWQIWLYPNGYKLTDSGYVSLYLCMASCNKAKIDVDFNLSVINWYNVKCNTMKQSESFVNGRGAIGFHNFIRRAELMDKTNGLLVDDTLRIHCTIHSGRLLKYSIPPSMERRNVIMPESRLPVDFWQLYLNKKLVDVTIEVNGKEFMAHKAVLAARSPVFASMFDTNMVESKNNRVVISDIEPEVFVELLRFMYSDQVETLDIVACDLLACAEKYAVERLKVMCEESIIENLSVESAAGVLLLADLHRAMWLKQEALDFIKFHPLKITRTDGWKTLIKYPHLVVEVFQSLADLCDDE